MLSYYAKSPISQESFMILYMSHPLFSSYLTYHFPIVNIDILLTPHSSYIK